MDIFKSLEHCFASIDNPADNSQTQKAVIGLLQTMYETIEGEGDDARHVQFLTKVYPVCAKLFSAASPDVDKFIQRILKNHSPWAHWEHSEIQTFAHTAVLARWTGSYQAFIQDPKRPANWHQGLSYDHELPWLHQLTHLGILPLIWSTIQAGIPLDEVDQQGRVFLAHVSEPQSLNLFLQDPSVCALLPSLIENWASEKKVRNWDARLNVAMNHAKTLQPKTWPEMFNPLLKKLAETPLESLYDALQRMGKVYNHVWATPPEVSSHHDWPLMASVSQNMWLQIEHHFKAKPILAWMAYPGDAMERQVKMMMGYAKDEQTWKTPEHALAYGTYPFLLTMAFAMRLGSRESGVANTMTQAINAWMGGDPGRFWADALETFDTLAQTPPHVQGSFLLTLFYRFNEGDRNKLNGFEAVEALWHGKLEAWLDTHQAYFMSQKKNDLSSEWTQLMRLHAGFTAKAIREGYYHGDQGVISVLIDRFKAGHITPAPMMDLISATREVKMRWEWNDEISQKWSEAVKRVPKAQQPVFEAFALSQSLSESLDEAKSKSKMRL